MMHLPPPIPGLLIGALIVAIMCTIECAVFVAMYWNVEKTREGKHLFRLSFILGLTFLMTLIFAFVPGLLLVKAILQLVLFVAISAELWVRIWLLHINQRRLKIQMLKEVASERVDD